MAPRTPLRGERAEGNETVSVFAARLTEDLNRAIWLGSSLPSSYNTEFCAGDSVYLVEGPGDIVFLIPAVFSRLSQNIQRFWRLAPGVESGRMLKDFEISGPVFLPTATFSQLSAQVARGERVDFLNLVSPDLPCPTISPVDPQKVDSAKARHWISTFLASFYHTFGGDLDKIVKTDYSHSSWTTYCVNNGVTGFDFSWHPSDPPSKIARLALTSDHGEEFVVLIPESGPATPTVKRFFDPQNPAEADYVGKIIEPAIILPSGELLRGKYGVAERRSPRLGGSRGARSADHLDDPVDVDRSAISERTGQTLASEEGEEGDGEMGPDHEAPSSEREDKIPKLVRRVRNWLFLDPDEPDGTVPECVNNVLDRLFTDSKKAPSASRSTVNVSGEPVAVRSGWHSPGRTLSRVSDPKAEATRRLRRVSDAHMSVHRAAVIMDDLGVDKALDGVGTFTLGILNAAASFLAFLHIAGHGARASISFVDYFKIAGYQAANLGHGVVRGLVGKVPYVGRWVKENVIPEYYAYTKSAHLLEHPLEHAIEEAEHAGLDEDDIGNVRKEDLAILKKWRDKAKKKGKGGHGADGHGEAGHGESHGTSAPVESPEAARKSLGVFVASHLMFADAISEVEKIDSDKAEELKEAIKRARKGNLDGDESHRGKALKELMQANKSGYDKALKRARTHFDGLMARCRLNPDPRSKSNSWFNGLIAEAYLRFSDPVLARGMKDPLGEDTTIVDTIVNAQFGLEVFGALKSRRDSPEVQVLIERIASSPYAGGIQDIFDASPVGDRHFIALGALMREVLAEPTA